VILDLKHERIDRSPSSPRWQDPALASIPTVGRFPCGPT
jgi:hypothetical protein